MLTQYWAAVFKPDFMQAMALCAAVFALPLEHKPHWKARLAALLAVSFTVGGALTLGYDQMLSGAMFTAFWSGMLFQAVFFAAPILVAGLIFRLCTTVNLADAVYGAACVYAVQHIHFCLTMICGQGTKPLLNWLLLLLALLASRFILADGLQQGGRYGVSRSRAAIVMGIMVFIGLAMNFPFRIVQGLRDSVAYTLGMAYDLCSCLLLLWLQLEQRRELRLATAAAAEQRLRIQMQDQYKISRESIEIINRKSHDLKHQVAALRLVTSPEQREASLRELEQAAEIYDAAVQTGNRVLDTVLTEKSLLCERDHISWTCMADGKLLDFVNPVDLYTMFGNALDNAIEASRQVPDEEMRNVSVTVQKQMGTVVIEVENYFVHPLQQQGGRLLSTKANVAEHGYGLESIRQVARRYGGSVEVTARSNIFSLSILMPLPV